MSKKIIFAVTIATIFIVAMTIATGAPPSFFGGGTSGGAGWSGFWY